MTCLMRIWEEMKLNELSKSKNKFNKSAFSSNRRSTYAKLSSDLPDIFLNSQTDRQTDGRRQTETEKRGGHSSIATHSQQ